MPKDPNPAVESAPGPSSEFVTPRDAAPESAFTDEAACSLLFAIARRPSARDTPNLRALARGIRDWDTLITLAQAHRVAPALFTILSSLEIPFPEAASRRLQADYQRNLLHNLASAAELVAILNLFEKADIRAMPFKGVVLAATAWGGLTTRPGGDLDLLLDERQVEPATLLLRERGYHLQTGFDPDGTQIAPENREYVLERPSDGMIVELRWRLDLVYGRFGHELGLDWVWPSRGVAEVAGAVVPALNPGAALLILCMHGSKHAWSRLVWIMDVARMADVSPEIDWNWLIREARTYGLARALALGMLLAHLVAGARVPPGALARFAADPTALRLAQHFARNLFRAPGIGPAGLVPYGLQLLGFRDRLRALSSLDLLLPNDRDFALVSLPRPLRGLYYLIRPFRILRDRSAR
jgi:hypothetical protein